MIGIQGIRVDNVSIERSETNDEISANYSLLSTTGKVLATQTVNGYQGIKVGMSGDSLIKLNEFLKSYKNDIQEVLGLNEETV